MRERIQIAALLCLVLAGAWLMPVPARAEPVQIRAAFGEIGQGWLFGSRRDGRCWLAMPLHVVTPEGSDVPGAFAFDDMQGRSSQSAPAIPVASVPGALEAAAGVSDLAFAPVSSGARRQGACNSRLGLSEGMYRVVLPQSETMQLNSMQGSSTARFAVEPARSLNGDDQGALLLLRPRDTRDQRYLKGGLSGAVALLDYQGQNMPAAMVLQVVPDNNTMRALRFDRIAAAFVLVEAHQRGAVTAPAAAAAQSVAHDIAAVIGRLEADAPPLSGLTQGQGGCWRIGLAPGERMVDIILSIPEGQRVESLRAMVPGDCGAPSSALLEMRRADGGWTTLSTNCPVVGDAGAICAIRRSGPMELRLRLDARSGPAAIGAVLLD